MRATVRKNSVKEELLAVSVPIIAKYLGGKKVELTHVNSGSSIVTSAPIDNQGDGSSFSPTDLLAASLGACMLTIMGIVAERRGIFLDGTRIQLTKIMQTDPRRVSQIPLEVTLSNSLSDEERQILEKAARTCPVFESLHPDINVDLSFHYE